MPHKFKIGDIVAIAPAISRNVPGGVYEVVKRLPGGDEPEYQHQVFFTPKPLAMRLAAPLLQHELSAAVRCSRLNASARTASL